MSLGLEALIALESSKRLARVRRYGKRVAFYSQTQGKPAIIMILVDTSVWVNHLRDGDKLLKKLLVTGNVVCHSFIIGELHAVTLKIEQT